MSTTSFALSVSHSQIAVFDSGLAQPFNLWTERHAKQSFAWRAGSVSFRTIADGGRHLVEVLVAAEEEGVEVSPDGARIIEIPFEVPPDGSIEIASVADAFPLELPSGMYALRFECLRPKGGEEPKVRLVFTTNADPAFAVFRADSELSVTGELLLTASAA